MTLTQEQMEQIRLISDGDLYQEVETFLADNGTVERTQINGLRDYAGSFSELEKFVKHQGSRNWQGGKEHYSSFYSALNQYLTDLRQRIKTQYKLVPENLSKKETRAQSDFFAGLLAQEFLQHLTAELTYQGKGR